MFTVTLNALKGMGERYLAQYNKTFNLQNIWHLLSIKADRISSKTLVNGKMTCNRHALDHVYRMTPGFVVFSSLHKIDIH